ncbi:MAG TPA: hypothetical protein VND93_10875, partial [Myxococcales bacterium]|nr:hypothetical protein [Myxococcales bacterium]
MRHIWCLGALILAGCMAHAVTPAPMVEHHDTVVVTPAPAPPAETAPPAESVPPGHGGTPPGQDPNFVPPGHGGTPPGQEKKEAAMEEAAPAADAAQPAAAEEEKSTEPAKPGKGKAKG